MSLAESQISFFYENGYLRLEDVLDKEDLQPVIDEYSEIIDKRAQKLYVEGKVSSLYEDEPFTAASAVSSGGSPRDRRQSGYHAGTRRSDL